MVVALVIVVLVGICYACVSHGIPLMPTLVICGMVALSSILILAIAHFDDKNKNKKVNEAYQRTVENHSQAMATYQKQLAEYAQAQREDRQRVSRELVRKNIAAKELALLQQKMQIAATC